MLYTNDSKIVLTDTWTDRQKSIAKIHSYVQWCFSKYRSNGHKGLDDGL